MGGGIQEIERQREIALRMKLEEERGQNLRNGKKHVEVLFLYSPCVTRHICNIQNFYACARESGRKTNSYMYSKYVSCQTLNPELAVGQFIFSAYNSNQGQHHTGCDCYRPFIIAWHILYIDTSYYHILFEYFSVD